MTDDIRKGDVYEASAEVIGTNARRNAGNMTKQIEVGDRVRWKGVGIITDVEAIIADTRGGPPSGIDGPSSDLGTVFGLSGDHAAVEWDIGDPSVVSARHLEPAP